MVVGAILSFPVLCVSPLKKKKIFPGGNDSTGDKELVAIMPVLKEWQYYLERLLHRIIIYTEHMTLKNLQTVNHLNFVLTFKLRDANSRAVELSH